MVWAAPKVLASLEPPFPPVPTHSHPPAAPAPRPACCQVLVEWRAKDPGHAAWVAALKELLQGLKVGELVCWKGGCGRGEG
jgi:hypothetical protein